MSLVCQTAPDFTASAVLADGTIDPNYSLKTSTKNTYAVLFFYPLDFTFVCPTEMIALHNRIEDFKNRNVEVITVSIDSVYTHTAWRNTPATNGGIGHVNYTMVADTKHEICRAYGVESEGGVAFRATFIIDRQGKVRSELINDLPIGRNIEEIIRTVDALQFNEAHGEVCPANWEKGKKGFSASAEGVASYLTENADVL